MTKTKSPVFTDFVAPIGVLTAICLVMSLLLAICNFVTAPIIEETARRQAEEARIEVLPEADSFQKLDVTLPEGNQVTEVYRAANGAGYVFMITARGYGGKGTLNMICGIGADGRITDTKVLSHAETMGMGSKITGDDFRGQFPGKDASLEGVDTITGATFSSNYYLAALRDAFAAYELVKEG